MPHDISLITTIAAGLGLAMLLGFVAVRLRMPPLIGYLIAGIIVGPATPGFIADVHLTSQLAEIGVMLLMFGVGLHFSIEDLMAVKRIAIPGAIIQIVLATIFGGAAGLWWGWSFGESLVFGLGLSVASTVVLLKALEARGLIDSINGRIAIGWLVVEDLILVLVLVLLPAFATLLGGHPIADGHHTESSHSIWVTILITLGKVVAFVAFMLIVGKRLLPKLLWSVAGTGSRELFSLCVVATAVGVAYGSAALFDVSFALGAFFAGMMLRESEFSHRAADESLPLRDAFAVLFFVSVGMLFDPRILLEEPVKVLIVVFIIMFGKTFAAMALVLAFRYPLNTALTVGASLAQIGEFSFILASLSVSLGLMDTTAHNLILAGAIASIALNSTMFTVLEPLQRWIRARSEFVRKFELRDDPLAVLPMSVDEAFLSGQVVLVGYGRVGRRIAQTLTDNKIPFVVVEANRGEVELLRAKDIPAVCGDAADPGVLIQAHIARAGLLIAATSNTFYVRKMIDIARTLNPTIETVVRTHNEEEAKLWTQEHIGKIFLSEEQLANGMTEYVLQRMGKLENH
ncbi:MAG: YbaL family putative K(+) efflux transporter [Cellvibrio sp.]